MDWHVRLGLASLGLFVFRLYWGFAGPETARFARFFPSPGKLGAYLKSGLRRPYRESFGHNPLGALSVFALLAGIGTMIGLGLFAVDVNGFAAGPLSDYLSFEAARDVAGWHETAFEALVILVGVHVVAVLAYTLLLKADLVGPMLTGKRARADGEPAPPVIEAPLWRVAIGAALAAASVWALLQAGP